MKVVSVKAVSDAGWLSVCRRCKYATGHKAVKWKRCLFKKLHHTCLTTAMYCGTKTVINTVKDDNAIGDTVVWTVYKAC